METCVIFCAGEFDTLAESIDKSDLIIAADGGLTHLEKLDMAPDAIIGDFDSLGRIPVGAQVNGKVIKMFVDYNSTVTNGQVVALIDPLVYEATYKSAVAQLHVNEANVRVRKAAIKTCEAELTLYPQTAILTA